MLTARMLYDYIYDHMKKDIAKIRENELKKIESLYGSLSDDNNDNGLPEFATTGSANRGETSSARSGKNESYAKTNINREMSRKFSMKSNEKLNDDNSESKTNQNPNLNTNTETTEIKDKRRRSSVQRIALQRRKQATKVRVKQNRKSILKKRKKQAILVQKEIEKSKLINQNSLLIVPKNHSFLVHNPICFACSPPVIPERPYVSYYIGNYCDHVNLVCNFRLFELVFTKYCCNGTIQNIQKNYPH
jgi:hypothetical protein